MDRKYALWLLPDDTSSSTLSKLIDTLSQRFNTPGFAPHATLCSGTWSGEPSALVSAAERLAESTRAIEAEPLCLGGIDAFFQFFYISLAQEGFEVLTEHARKLLLDAHTPEVGPHISLMYSDDFKGIDRVVLAKELADKIPGRITLSSLALVFPKNNDWWDIAYWKVENIFRITFEE